MELNSLSRRQEYIFMKKYEYVLICSMIDAYWMDDIGNITVYWHRLIKKCMNTHCLTSNTSKFDILWHTFYKIPTSMEHAPNYKKNWYSSTYYINSFLGFWIKMKQLISTPNTLNY